MGFKDSERFKKAVSATYKDMDVDGTGLVDYKEVMIGLLRVYDKVNSQLPGHVCAPSRAKMMQMCVEFDKDGDGNLDESEFLELARVLAGTRDAWRDSLLWTIGSALFLKLVLFPLAASFLAGLLIESHLAGGDGAKGAAPLLPPPMLAAVIAAALGVSWGWLTDGAA